MFILLLKQHKIMIAMRPVAGGAGDGELLVAGGVGDAGRPAWGWTLVPC